MKHSCACTQGPALGADGIAAIAMCLPARPTLLRLDLDSNELFDNGAIILASGLPAARYLSQLHLVRGIPGRLV